MVVCIFVTITIITAIIKLYIPAMVIVAIDMGIKIILFVVVSIKFEFDLFTLFLFSVILLCFILCFYLLYRAYRIDKDERMLIELCNAHAAAAVQAQCAQPVMNVGQPMVHQTVINYGQPQMAPQPVMAPNQPAQPVMMPNQPAQPVMTPNQPAPAPAPVQTPQTGTVQPQIQTDPAPAPAPTPMQTPQTGTVLPQVQPNPTPVPTATATPNKK
uniref:Uncharacterized protein n=1 Tax=Panagrolaimus sp. JU765 TaxID=591449 RepID=A0AC34RS92_9BILA